MANESNEEFNLDMEIRGDLLYASYAGTKVAHVDMNTSDLELNRFGENVAANRGLQIRSFSNAADAEAWVNE